MLRLKALHVEDFGPFKNHQTVSFSPEDGVTVVYGENMRGKTSFLNAIRFAFFGRVIGRGAKASSLHQISNWEKAAEGKYGFEVQLEFEHGGAAYKLVRTCKPRPGATPASDADYSVDFFLERDGQILGPQQGQDDLKRILPEQISRFFLFDGELLQEYEDLLSSESDMGRRISEAIERILGVPVLTSARVTLLRLREKAEKREATAAQGDQKTRELGNLLLDLQAKRSVLQEDIVRLTGELEELRGSKASLEETMKRRERVAALLDKRDGLARSITEIEGRSATKLSELTATMANSWVTLIADRMKQTQTDLQAQEAELQTALLRADVLASLRESANTECPACLQAVSAEARERIEESLRDQGAATRAEQESALVTIRQRLAAIAQCAALENAEIVRVRWSAFDDTEVDIASKKSDLAEVQKQLQDIDEDELRETRMEFEGTIRKIDATERGIAATRVALDANKVDSDKIQRRLDKLGGASLSEERRRREFYAELHSLFDDAVAAYREQLRKRVEADATRHFQALTTEPEYSGLRINDSYGLTVVHEDGADIPVRSAGAEHVVALCLMGALQNNAPLRGPIIIDSPFGRLDSEHTRNIVRALPTMTKQVVLLVYEDELPPDLVRRELKAQLRGEWRLERRSARHTELVPRRD